MRIRSELPTQYSLVLSGAGVASVLLLWLVLTAGGSPESRMMSPLILPSPGEVLTSFPVLHWEKGLTLAVLASLQRVTLGFLLAACLALPLGVSMAIWTPVRRFFEPLVAISTYVPIPALLPLSIAWFGIAEKQKVLFLAIAIFIALLPLVVAALDDVDEIYLQTGYTLGASWQDTVLYIMLPVAMPAIWSALRTMYGVGWSWILLAEVVDAQTGLGFLIQSAQRRSQVDHVFAVLVVIVVLAVLIDAGFRLVGNLLFPYEEGAR